MFFELNGKTYGVKFSRHEKSTYAELKKVNETSGLDTTGILSIAKPYYTDRFEKSKGRKEALAGLLDDMQQFHDENPERYPDYNMTKEVRTMIWETYFKTHRK